MKRLKRSLALVMLATMMIASQAQAIQNCYFDTPKYAFANLKTSSTGPYVNYMVQWGYICYGNMGAIQPAILLSYGNGHSSMTAWLNAQLSVPAGYSIYNAGTYVTAMSGWSQCHTYSAPGGPIQYWNTGTNNWDYYQTTEWYTEMGGTYCCVDTTINAFDDAKTPRKPGVSSEAAERERQPKDVPDLSTSDLLRLAELHQTYLNNRATREQRDIFMDRMQAAMFGYSDQRGRAVAMEASLRAAVSELEGRAIPLGNHVRRGRAPVQSTP